MARKKPQSQRDLGTTIQDHLVDALRSISQSTTKNPIHLRRIAQKALKRAGIPVQEPPLLSEKFKAEQIHDLQNPATARKAKQKRNMEAVERRMRGREDSLRKSSPKASSPSSLDSTHSKLATGQTRKIGSHRN